MKGSNFTPMFLRDIDLVIQEIQAYKSEADLWVQLPGIVNTGGMLAKHLAGNLRHFFGHIMGGSIYTRNRDAEFSNDSLSRETLVEELEQAKSEVRDLLETISDDQLNEISLVKIFGEITTEAFIVQLFGHLNYHRGQLNYHRRISTTVKFQ